MVHLLLPSVALLPTAAPPISSALTKDADMAKKPEELEVLLLSQYWALSFDDRRLLVSFDDRRLPRCQLLAGGFMVFMLANDR